MLPERIRLQFYRTLNAEISLPEFEQWVYAETELENVLRAEDYLDLISLSYQRSGARHDLFKILRRLIDAGAFETWRLMGLLREALQRNDRLAAILVEFYDLYCSGYSFMQVLGMQYGLCVNYPPAAGGSTDHWNTLPEAEQKEVLDKFFPGLGVEIEKVLNWLEEKKIVLTGGRDEVGHFSYEDFRSKEERKLDSWGLEDIPPEKRWWQFWK